MRFRADCCTRSWGLGAHFIRTVSGWVVTAHFLCWSVSMERQG